MRRIVTVVLLAAALLAWWHCYDLSVKAQAGGGDAVPEETACYDANGDGSLDISDPVWLLQWLFNGGPEPVACADGCVDLTPQECAALKEVLADLEFGRRVAGTWVWPLGIYSLNPLGGVIGTTTNDFAPHATAHASHRFDSPTLASWQRTGERQITVTELSYHYDEGGQLVEITKAITVANLSEDFNRACGVSTYLYFLPSEGEDALAFLECGATPVRESQANFCLERLCTYPAD
jgi:hypothetical protein